VQIFLLRGKNTMTGSTTQAQVHIYESEYRAIIAATRLFIHEETGGDLYGSFTHAGMPVIWLASGPGPHVRRNSVHFEQDSAFTTDWQRKLKDDFGLQFIGTWHSHHRLGLREPSSGDREAARTYARNHNRQKTLEIIVTYERRDEVALWPYFYPNAQQERWVESTFVVLPRTSPIRQHLGNDEVVFSGGGDWRSVPAINNSRGQHARRDALNDASAYEGSSQQVAIPPKIQSEIESIGDRILDINQTGPTFIASIRVGKGRNIDVYIDLRSLNIMHIDLIDEARRSKLDISEIAREEHFPLSLYQTRGVLKRLVSDFSRIQRKLERPASHNNGTEAPASLMQQMEIPQPELRNDATENQRTGMTEHDQPPVASQDTSTYMNSPDENVSVLVTTNGQYTYHLSITLSGKEQVERLLQAFKDIKIYKEHMQFTPKEGVKSSDVQISVVLQEVSNVEIVLEQLTHTFMPIQFSCDKETQEALYQSSFVDSASISQDTQGNIIGKLMKKWRSNS
jgi:hypothetical protein